MVLIESVPLAIVFLLAALGIGVGIVLLIWKYTERKKE